MFSQLNHPNAPPDCRSRRRVSAPLRHANATGDRTDGVAFLITSDSDQTRDGDTDASAKQTTTRILSEPFVGGSLHDCRRPNHPVASTDSGGSDSGCREPNFVLERPYRTLISAAYPGRLTYVSPPDDDTHKAGIAQHIGAGRVSPVTTACRVGAATAGPAGASPVVAPPRRSSVGAQFDRNTAVAALTAAREALANTWRNRHVPLTGWVGRHMERNYPFWRAANLARVMRCRAAVALTEARVRAVMAAG